MDLSGIPAPAVGHTLLWDMPETTAQPELFQTLVLMETAKRDQNAILKGTVL